MIYSILHKKNTNEDPKTSIVFENLMLLPDNVFWDILKSAASNQGVLPENVGLMADQFYFWPKWNPNSVHDTGNVSYVEPDVFFRFENIDVIVEAKYYDHIGQYREEWEREFKAYLNEYGEDEKEVILLAVGGNRNYDIEPVMQVANRKCRIIKISWVALLNAVLAFEEKTLSCIRDDKESSMKRIIRNIECGCKNVGIIKYKNKVNLKGLSNLYILGKIFQSAANRKAESCTLTYYSDDIKSTHYGIYFEVKPKDDKIPSIWLGIALWINGQETICVKARDKEGWADILCRQIDRNKAFSSKYADKPYIEDYLYYFDASENFYQEFSEAQTFDGQVEIIFKLINDICLYYIWCARV